MEGWGHRIHQRRKHGGVNGQKVGEEGISRDGAFWVNCCALPSSAPRAKLLMALYHNGTVPFPVHLARKCALHSVLHVWLIPWVWHFSKYVKYAMTCQRYGIKRYPIGLIVRKEWPIASLLIALRLGPMAFICLLMNGGPPSLIGSKTMCHARSRKEARQSIG